MTGGGLPRTLVAGRKTKTSVSMQEKNLQGETEPFQLEYNLISIFLFCTYLQINTLKGSLREVSDLMFLKWDQTKELFC